MPFNLPTQNAMQFKFRAVISKSIPSYTQWNFLGQTAGSRCEGFPAFHGLTRSARNVGKPSRLDAAVCRTKFHWLLSPRKLQVSCHLHIINKKNPLLLQEPFLHQTSWFFFIMSRFLRLRRCLLPGAECTWVSSLVLYPSWFLNSNFNYVRQLPSTLLCVTGLSSCHERPILRQGLSQVINPLVSISLLNTLLNKTNEMIFINTFTAIVDLSRFNNSCLKSPATTLVDLTFQSRALRSFSLNQLRNLSL